MYITHTHVHTHTHTQIQSWASIPYSRCTWTANHTTLFSRPPIYCSPYLHFPIFAPFITPPLTFHPNSSLISVASVLSLREINSTVCRAFQIVFIHFISAFMRDFYTLVLLHHILPSVRFIYTESVTRYARRISLCRHLAVVCTNTFCVCENLPPLHNICPSWDCW